MARASSIFFHVGGLLIPARDTVPPEAAEEAGAAKE